MSQEYSNPRRANLPYSLPDIEVFHADDYPAEDGDEPLADGFYWWSCFPGCMPAGEPNGPFDTEEEALADAQDGEDDSEDEDMANIDDIDNDTFTYRTRAEIAEELRDWLAGE